MPCRNESSSIEACLRGILAFDSPPGGFEVLVVDGRSTDGSREIVMAMAKADPRILLLDNPEQTTAPALNRGILAARGDVIVRVDAHTEYARDYLVQCLTAMNETRADNVGGPSLTRAGTYWQQAMAAAFHSRFAVGGSRFHQIDYEGWADTVPYGCYRRETLLKLGMFDEELVRNQDDELNYRLIRQGGKIWQTPKIRSWYWPRPRLAQLFRQYHQYGYWKVRVIQKHRMPASWRHLIPGAFVLMLSCLSLLSLCYPPATWGLALLCGLYLGTVLLGAVLAAGRTRLRLMPALPLVFAAYHFGYGTGFLLGLWDFVARPQRPRASCVALTR